MLSSPGFERLTVLRCLLAGSLLLSTVTVAQIYRVTDENGNVVFTDRPANPSDGESVEKVEIQTTNSAPAVAPRPAQSSGDAEPQTPTAAPVNVSIVSPASETTIAMGPGNFSVSASTSPALGRNERLLLLIDGQAHGEAQRSSSWFVEGAVRGQHDLRVARLNAAGDTVAESEDVRIYVLRPSIAR